MIVPPRNVFNKVEALRTLDSVNIAMTDYGFWDIETNQTNSKTYSYRGAGKRYEETEEHSFNGREDKIIHPTVPYDPSIHRYSEYDTCWTLNDGWWEHEYPEMAVRYPD